MDDNVELSDAKSLIQSIAEAADRTLKQFGTKQVLLSVLTRVSILEKQVISLHDRLKQYEHANAAIGPVERSPIAAASPVQPGLHPVGGGELHPDPRNSSLLQQAVQPGTEGLAGEGTDR